MISSISAQPKLNSGANEDHIKFWDVCYHSVQNILSSTLLSENKMIKTQTAIILLKFCMGMKFGLS